MAKHSEHVCRPPHGILGLLWICPDCWSEFVYRPVASGELGRVVNLWVRWYEPPGRSWVPLEKRYKRRKQAAR